MQQYWDNKYKKFAINRVQSHRNILKSKETNTKEL